MKTRIPSVSRLIAEAGERVVSRAPYFLDDLRPAGFHGWLFVRRIASGWGYATDPRDWSEEQLGRCRLGEPKVPGTCIRVNADYTDCADYCIAVAFMTHRSRRFKFVESAASV